MSNLNHYTKPVRKMQKAPRARIQRELAEIRAAHGVPYELAYTGGMWRVMVGHFPSGRVDIVTRASRGPYLVVSGVEWESEVQI